MSFLSWWSSNKSRKNRSTIVRQKNRRNFLRGSRRLQMEQLEGRALLASLVTDALDYSPGQTVYLTASEFAIGEPVKFQVTSSTAGPGQDPWIISDGIIDGGAGDLDGLPDGNVSTSWLCDPEGAYAGATLTATALGLSSGESASAVFTDSAIFTSNFDGTVINQNIYDAKTDVYFTGGPGPSALKEGDYYFKVTTPDGDLLSTDTQASRAFHINASGEVDSATHATYTKLNGGKTFQLAPFADTTNSGGEYKLTVISKADYDDNIARGKAGYQGAHLFDGFKVKVETPPPPPDTNATVTFEALKFEDVNGNHLQDAEDLGIPNWPIIITINGTPTTHYTDANGSYNSPSVELEIGSTWSITEGSQAGWINTYSNTVDGSGTIESINSVSGYAEFGNHALATISIDKTANPTTVSEGGDGNQDVIYTYLVKQTNAGNTGLAVVVTDTDGPPQPTYQSGDANNDNLLQKTETWTYTLTVTMTPQNAGATHTNTGTATGTDGDNTTIGEDDATVTYEDVAPEITVVKTGSVSSVSEGGVGNQKVTYSYAVTNSSDAKSFDPLSGVTLTDTDGTPTYVSGDAGIIGLLETGETWIYTLGPVTLAAANAGASHTNTATASGTDDENNIATDTDDATVTYTDVAPEISVIKTPNVGIITVGGTVTFTYIVTNTSPAGVFDPLSDVSLSDTDGTPSYVSGDVGIVGLLEVGETWTYTLTKANVQPNAGPNLDIHTNMVTATGTDDENNVATGTDVANVVVLELGDGRTKGFWGNNNGKAVLTNAGQSVNWVAGLNALNLRNVNGSDFVLPGTTNSTTAWNTLERWLKDSNATNMQFMLSAQLAATWLNTNVDMNFATAGVQTGVAPNIVIYLPAIYDWGASAQGANLKTNLYGAGSSPLSAGESVASTTSSFVTLAEVMSNANQILGNFGNIGSTSGTNGLYRLHAEALKNVCDAVNNSYAANTLGSGAIFVSPATYAWIQANWHDDDNDGIIDGGELG